jgi:hypothetical protein
MRLLNTHTWLRRFEIWRTDALFATRSDPSVTGVDSLKGIPSLVNAGIVGFVRR